MAIVAMLAVPALHSFAFSFNEISLSLLRTRSAEIEAHEAHTEAPLKHL